MDAGSNPVLTQQADLVHRGTYIMERKMANLFDFQRFQQNPKLKRAIQDVEGRYAAALDDDDLDLVSAAGVVVNIILHEEQSKDEDDAYVDRQKRSFR